MEAKKKFFIDRWLDRFCEDYLLEGIQGDLEELYRLDITAKGKNQARIRYYLRALSFFRYTFYSKRKKHYSNYEAMWKNHLTITLRNLKKHTAYSFINILGLAVGMAAGFLILQYVYYETTYDRFFVNKENIYRVQQNRYNKGELTTQWAAGGSAVGKMMKEDFPEVVDYVKLYSWSQPFSFGENSVNVDFGFFATPNFFQVFSVPLIRGNDSTALMDHYTAVVSQDLATKLFGSEDPMGKNIKSKDGAVFLITGVFQDLPEKSHMKFDILFSMSTWLSWVGGEEVDNEWNWDGWLNYVVLRDGTRPAQLETKFTDFVEARQGESLRRYDSWVEYNLQPLTEIHLTSDYRGEIKPTGDKTATYFLLIIGLFVMIIAWINYINLTTARSLNRAREVGVRKVLGSYRAQLVSQFLFESIFTNLIALLLAVSFIFIFFPFFNEFAGRSQWYTWPDAMWFWTALTGIFLLGILLSGFYPALVLSGFKPASVLKGKFTASTRGNLIRKGLVVFQFLASIILITGTYIVYKQLHYLQSQDLGVNIDQTLVIESNRHYQDSISTPRYNLFKTTVLQQTEVSGFTTSSSVPGRTPEWNAGGIRLLHETDAQSNQYRILQTDDQFISFYDLEVIAGRGFDRSFGNEPANVIFNESAMKRIGFTNPEELLHQKIFFWGDTFNVIGVVKDYHQESPKASYDALIFRYSEAAGNFYSLKLRSRNYHETLTKLEAEWNAVHANLPFNYFFLNDYYNEQYKSELRFGSIFGLFSGLAIFVACLGLFGLASFMMTLRLKEVSIRKVLGASFANLWFLLTKDFVKLVTIAILISVTPSWYLMNEWLNNYASRITLSWHLFLIPALVLIGIALATISYHTFYTAHTSPAKNLKEE